ncbi:MAG: CRISPR-associated endonuclease Cas3'' [Candidatus Bathyarchaeia archaeon]
MAALLVWEKIKPYYWRSIVRVLGDTFFDPIALAIALHDLGKLTKAYSKHRKDFRHELFGAYATYDVLRTAIGDSDVSYLVATSVLLHHEPIAMKIVGEYGERYLTISNLKRVIVSYDLSPSCDVEATIDKIINDLLIKNKYIDTRLRDALKRFCIKWVKEVSGDEVYSALKKIIAWATIMGDSNELLVRRAKVASLLHLLIVSDSIAANIVRQGRCGSSGRDEGTYITKRALHGAELLNDQVINEINKIIDAGD